MVNRDFNEDITDYITKIRDRKVQPIRKRNKEVKLSVEQPLSTEEKNHLLMSDESTAVVIKKKPWWRRFFGPRTEEEIEAEFEDTKEIHTPQEDIYDELEKIEKLEQQEEKIERERKGLIQIMLEKIRLFSEPAIEETILEPEEEHINVDRVDPDLIRVLCIADDLLAKLPKEEKLKFMKKDEFILYKNVFKRYRIKELGRG